ncbi:MAG: DUF3179 domain-containing protein [Planctomycetes bacterium]|nr:DUF3179 domain-containing protein [Planctomycetota bacterium]
MSREPLTRPIRKTITARQALPLFVGLGLLLMLLGFWQYQITSNDPPDALHGSRSVASYGFDLSTCLIPAGELIGTDARKGDIPPLSEPKTMAAAEVIRAGKLMGTYPLLPGDRVIGVAIAGAARAYPIWVLTAHEACNDQLGDVPIAVTYSPLCDSAVVFDRRVGDETLTFAASGVLYNSNTLLYDRRESGGESLWSQLQARAVAGPAAARGETLAILPSALVTWEQWRFAHPETSAILPEPGRRKFYRPNAFATYFADPRLRYAVNPRPSERYSLKTPVVAYRESDRWVVTAASEVDPLRDGRDRPAIFSLWFAWSSLRPADQ